VVGTGDKQMHIYDLTAGSKITDYKSPLQYQTRCISIFHDKYDDTHTYFVCYAYLPSGGAFFIFLCCFLSYFCIMHINMNLVPARSPHDFVPFSPLFCCSKGYAMGNIEGRVAVEYFDELHTKAAIGTYSLSVCLSVCQCICLSICALRTQLLFLIKLYYIYSLF
jgi:hypothetical protein